MKIQNDDNSINKSNVCISTKINISTFKIYIRVSNSHCNDILLLFFMKIICVQIPCGKFYQALSSQMKRLTNTKFAMSCDLT
jgi:hypothetical protein